MPSEQRLHPLSFVFTIGSSLKSFLFPAIFALFAVRSGNYDLFFAVFIIPYAIFSVIRYLTYRYSFAEDDLVIRTGLLFHNERHIPYARIHNVGAVQSVFHRLFGVVEVVLETAGGKEPEARLQVLSVKAMEEMKVHILRKKLAVIPVADAASADPVGPAAAAAASEDAAPRTLLRLPVSELLVLGLVENRGGVVIAAFFGVLWEVGFLGSTSLSGFLSRAFSTASDLARPLMSFVQTGILVGAAVVLFFVAMRVFSMIWAVVKLWDFHLQRSGRDLTTTCGLLTKVTATIPLNRVQVVSIRQKPLHRLFGRAELRVEIAGGGEESDKRTTRPERLAPIVELEMLPGLLKEIQPGVDLDAVRWQMVDPRAAGRIFRASLLLMTPLAAWVPLALWRDDVRFAALILIVVAMLIPVAWLNARMQTSHYGYAEESGVLFYKSGWIWRRTSMARCSKIQVMTLTESPWDRRTGMAGVRIDTAGARPAGHRLAIPYLPAATARTIFDRLSAQAAHTAFGW